MNANVFKNKQIKKEHQQLHFSVKSKGKVKLMSDNLGLKLDFKIYSRDALSVEAALPLGSYTCGKRYA